MLRVSMMCVVVCSVLVAAPGVFGQAAAPRNVPGGLSATDWSSIRQAYEVGCHAAHAMEGGYRTRNPGQRWQTRFDGRGFTTAPDAGGWTWGLQLQSFGFAGHERTVTQPAQVSAAGGRVAYEWDDTLTEWYVNDTRGLEHGYTIHRRPCEADEGEAEGPLTFTLAIRGKLVPEVKTDGRGARFVNTDGATVLTYSGLTVIDADGQSLPARLESVSEGMVLTVDERGARYPLTVDPIAQQAYLKASNTNLKDQFGFSISVSGDTVVVGAPRESSNASGVNGDQSDNSTFGAGAVYVFVRSGTVWSQQAYLKASNPDEVDEFGRSVGVSGNTVVVGAWLEDSNATGANGDGNDNSASQSGAAYVFVRSGTTWSQEAYLKAANTDGADAFGFSVGVSGDTVVVGSRFEDSAATGVDGNASDNSVTASGAVYVFVRSGTTWSQEAYLKASNTGALDEFGFAVAVSGDTVAVSAYLERSNAIGVNGDQSDNSLTSAGAAYVFVRSGATWSQQAYLKASSTDAGDEFGWSIAASGDTVVVGARTESSSATGVNGDPTDNSAASAGAAYVFTRSGATWGQQAYLKASNTDASDLFGSAVAVSGNTAVVGAVLEASNATGVNGDQSNNSFFGAGAAYVFVRNGTSWTQQVYLKASNSDGDDCYGVSVAVAGNTIVVGARSEASNATGVNGNQLDNSAFFAGAAYVFDITPDPWSDMGCALAGASGDPLLEGMGSLAGGSSNSIDLTGAAPTAVACLFVALSSIPVPFKGGTVKPFPVVIEPVIMSTSGTGSVSLPFTLPAGVPAGTELWLQWAIVDVAAVEGVSLSNALLGVTP